MATNARWRLAATLLAAAQLLAAAGASGQTATWPDVPGQNPLSRRYLGPPPLLVRVDVDQRGYVLIGAGFGSDASIVQVYEN